MKPFGLCGRCEYECGVETETNARVIHCVYRADFEKAGGYIKKRKKVSPARNSVKKPLKTARNRGIKK